MFLEQNRNFPKRRWVRSRNVFLSSGGLVASVVTEEAVLRTSSDLSTWKYTCFLFKCRVTFRLRQTSKATFGTLALYILRLRCLVISKTYKNSFCFLSKIETFQNDVEYVPKMSVWALLGLFLWWSLKNLYWELPQISLLETIRVFCWNAESRLGCAGCRKLRLILGFKSCIWDIQYQMLKKQFFIFWKGGLRRFGLCTFFLKVSVQIFEKCRPMSPKPINVPLKMTLREAQSLRFELCFACFSSCEWKSCCEKFERLMFVK